MPWSLEPIGQWVFKTVQLRLPSLNQADASQTQGGGGGGGGGGPKRPSGRAKGPNPGGPYGISSPRTGHSITYGKFVMDKYIKEEITHMIFIHKSPNIQISYVSKT